MIIVLFICCDGYIAIIELVVCVFLFFMPLLALEFSLEIAPKGRVLAVCLYLELFIWKVKEEDAEEIVCEANNRLIEGKLVNVGK